MSQEVEGFHQPLLNGKYSKSLDAGQDAAASGSLDPFPTSKGMSDVTSDLPARRTLFSMSSRFSAANTPWWPHTREMYLSSVDGAPVKRPKRRQIFLVMTKPASSIASFIFFMTLMSLMVAAIAFMAMETMPSFLEQPSICPYSCDEDDEDCVCEPRTVKWLVELQDYLYYLFTVEYLVRHMVFYPVPEKAGGSADPHIVQFLKFATHPWQLIDLLAIAPFWLENWLSVQSLQSVRIVRLSRIFQVVKLGKYNKTFVTFGRVMGKSAPALNLLAVILFFGMCLFGSLIYEFERGNWKPIEEGSDDWQYMRKTTNGIDEEISPFQSIPTAFWWFIVTATTVGYGDMYPTSTWGRFIAVLAMLMSLIVVAFPISVFTHLWEEEFNAYRGSEVFARESDGGGGRGSFGRGSFGGSFSEYDPNNSSKAVNYTVGAGPEKRSSVRFIDEEGGEKASEASEVSNDKITLIKEQMKIIDEARAKISSILDS
ncbi:hypothetical protein TrVE_jg3139 [Triparma verrucosa]|uniref:Ion transport domain-containing protein n=1 Tax=Triparma verrucosa TaxID=1606542 RepID=A0A9W7EQI4_9STRA|nr:hypothetical protein TrVE_jg3139 [Triparma verrucosa]